MFTDNYRMANDLLDNLARGRASFSLNLFSRVDCRCKPVSPASRAGSVEGARTNRTERSGEKHGTSHFPESLSKRLKIGQYFDPPSLILVPRAHDPSGLPHSRRIVGSGNEKGWQYFVTDLRSKMAVRFGFL